MKNTLKFILKTISIITCVCLVHTQVAFAYDLRITINDDIIKEAGPQMYGMDYTFQSLEPFINEDLSLNYDAIDQLREYPFTNSRMMGTASRYYRWKNSIGPMSERDYIGYYSFTKDKAGIVEWIKFVKALNSDATFTFSLNLETDTASNAADLAEFLCGDGTTNPNGGINWAEKRIELGLSEPVDVVWELGNETDQTSFNLLYSFSPKDYVRVCKKYISAIRKVDSDAVFAAHSATNSLSFETPETQITNRGGWNRYVLENLQNDIDYFIFHCYGNITQNYLKLKLNLDFAVEDMKNILSEENKDRIKLYFTEYSVSVSGDINDEKYRVGHQLKGGLAVAEMINRLLSFPEIERANYHIFMNPHTRGAFYQTDVNGVNEGKFKASVMGEILKMYADYGIGTVVNSSLEFFIYTWSDYYKHSSYAGVTNVVVKNGDNYNVFVCNQENTSHSLTMDLPEGTYKYASKKIITGDSLTSSNWYSSTYPDIAETEDLQITYANPGATVVNKKSVFNVPKYSICVFELERID